MTLLLITLAALSYLAGYTITAAIIIRGYGWDTERCHHRRVELTQRECDRLCPDRRCWRTGPRDDEVLPAFGLPLAWPLAVLPYLAYRIATRPRRLATADRIAELEDELNIREDR